VTAAAPPPGGERSGPPRASAVDIAVALHVLHEPGSVVELRVLGAEERPGYRATRSGYYGDFDLLAEHAAAWSGRSEGVYVALNPVNPALLARAQNRCRQVGKGETTTDRDVTRRRWLLVDIDWVRPAGISSSDAELAAAIERAGEVRVYTTGLGWPAPVEARSGNGAHLLYRIDLPADDGGIVKRTLEGLHAKFSADGVKIDTSVFNPARITKCYGTLAAKGDSIADRPHRLSSLTVPPGPVGIVTPEMLELVAVPAKPMAATAPADTVRPRIVSTFDVERWIGEHLPDATGPDPYEGGRRWILPVCPFNCEHARGEAWIIERGDGPLAAGCRHDSCRWGWRDLRERHEPGCYSAREEGAARRPDDTVRDPDNMPTNDNVAGPVAPPKVRWIIQLTDLIGDQEPDGDDSEDWILRDIIPRGEPSMLAGPAKHGKSYVMLDLGLSVATGTGWLDGKVENTLGRPGRVLILALEDSVRRIRARLWRLARGRGMTPNDPLIREYLRISRAPVRIPDRADMRALRDELAIWPPDLIQLDCLARVMVGDESDATAAKEYASGVMSICVDLGIAVETLHHTRKANNESRDRWSRLTLDDVRGSSDLVASVRHVAIWQQMRLEDRHVARLASAGNLDIRVEERAVELVSEDRGGGNVADRMVDRGDVGALLTEAREGRKAERSRKGDREKQGHIQRALRLAITTGQVSTSALATVAGIPDTTATRLLREMVELGYLARTTRTAPATVTAAGLAAFTGDL
jgi:hypothetical protein